MYPVLFAYGPLTIKTMSLFLLLAFLSSAFIFWRRGREEHYKEDQLFDGFLLAVIFGLIIARVVYVVTNFQVFGFSFLNWLDVLSNPGFSGFAGLVASGWYLFRYSRKNRWDEYEVLDFFAPAVAIALTFASFGTFLDGSGYGYETNLPVGVTFPNVLEPHHPVQLYFFVFYLMLYLYLTWAEYHYRTFNWYRFSKSTAQTGFLLSAFIISVGLINFIFSFLKPPSLEIFGINLQAALSLVAFFIGVGLLYVRSGRVIPFSEGSKKKKAREQRFQR